MVLCIRLCETCMRFFLSDTLAWIERIYARELQWGDLVEDDCLNSKHLLGDTCVVLNEFVYTVTQR
jgi:hypothetical protein